VEPDTDFRINIYNLSLDTRLYMITFGLIIRQHTLLNNEAENYSRLLQIVISIKYYRTANHMLNSQKLKIAI
jgi:hypothetical protein